MEVHPPMTFSGGQRTEYRSSERSEIAAIVARLFSHFFVPSMSEAVLAAIIEDWVADLLPFGPRIVADACAEYRKRAGVKRPVLGDVYAICMRERDDYAAPKTIQLQPGELQPWQQDIWGRGSEGRAARDTAIAEHDRRYRRAAKWRELGGIEWEEAQRLRLAQEAGYSSFAAFAAQDEPAARAVFRQWQHTRHDILEEG